MTPAVFNSAVPNCSFLFNLVCEGGKQIKEVPIEIGKRANSTGSLKEDNVSYFYPFLFLDIEMILNMYLTSCNSPSILPPTPATHTCENSICSPLENNRRFALSKATCAVVFLRSK